MVIIWNILKPFEDTKLINLHGAIYTLVFYHLARQFAKLSNKHCIPILDGYFDSRYDAEVACDQMQSTYGNCTTINDKDCDDDLYTICESDAELHVSNIGSCVYHAGA